MTCKTLNVLKRFDISYLVTEELTNVNIFTGMYLQGGLLKRSLNVDSKFREKEGVQSLVFATGFLKLNDNTGEDRSDRQQRNIHGKEHIGFNSLWSFFGRIPCAT